MKIKTNRRKIAALNYLKRGWSIVPVGRKKVPLIPWKEYQDRLPTIREIDEWLKKWPHLNWAVVTGPLSKLIILDIDPRHGGNESLVALIKRHGWLLTTVKVKTGGNGRHYYFAHPGIQIRSAILADGVELKGDNALVTMPPSIHESGKPYEWTHHPDDYPIAPLSKWLLHLSKARTDANALTAQQPTSTKFSEGNRNQGLTSIAGALRARGFGEQAIANALNSLNQTLCSPPLVENEIASIAKSVANYPSKSDSAAYTSISTAETKWITSQELSEQELEDIEWLWGGYLGSGIVTLFSARPKTGKTTLLFYLLKATLARQKFLQCETSLKRKVLLLSEEPLSLLKRRIKKHGLESDDFLIIPRFKLKDWSEAVAYANHAVEKEGVQLIVIDTIAAFWNVQNENDATHIMEALRPIQEIVQKHRVALLLIHHLRKADGSDGTAHRGSGALVGAVEIALEMGKLSNNKEQRLLSGVGRYEETPSEVVIELREDGYYALGSPEQTSFAEVQNKVLAVVPAHNEKPIDPETIEARLPEPKPKKTTLKDVLASLTNAGQLERTGKGVRNSPYLYRKSPPNVLVKAPAPKESAKPPVLKAAETKKPAKPLTKQRKKPGKSASKRRA